MNLKKIVSGLAVAVKVSVYVCLFALIFMHSRFYFPFIVPKNVLFHVTVELMLAAYLILIIVDKTWLPKFKNKIILSTAVFFGIATIATIFSLNFSNSFWGNYERMSGLFHWWHLLAFFTVIVGTFKVKKDWHDFFTFSVFISMVMSIIAFSQFLNIPFLIQSSGGARLTGTIGNAAFLAAYLLFNLFFLVYFLVKRESFNLTQFFYSTLGLLALVFASSLFAKIGEASDWGKAEILKQPMLQLLSPYIIFWLPLVLLLGMVAWAWFERKKTSPKLYLLWILLIFEVFIFLNTQTRGALLGVLAAAVMLGTVVFYIGKSKRSKIFGAGTSLAILILFAVLYLFGADIANWMFGIEKNLSVWSTGLLGTSNPEAVEGFKGIYQVPEKLFFSAAEVINRLDGLAALAGIYLALLLSIFAAFYVTKVQNKRQQNRIWLGVAAVVILGPLVWLVANISLVQGRVASLNEGIGGDLTTESRLLTWKASWQGWTEDPKTFLLGVGPENYYYIFNKNFPVAIYKDEGSRIWFDRAHNIIFDIGTTTGLIGLAAYLAIFLFAILALLKIFKHENEEGFVAWLFIGLLIAYFIQNIFVFDTLNSEVLFFLSLGFVVYLAGGVKEKAGGAQHELNTEKYVYIATVLLILIAGLYFINWRIIKSNQYLVQALLTSGRTKVENYQQGIQTALTGRHETRDEFAKYILDLSASEATSNQVLPVAKLGIEELQKSIEEEPTNIRHYLMLSNVYNALSRFDKSYAQKAVELVESAAYLSPNRPQVYFQIGQSHALGGNLSKAEEYIIKSIELSPTVTDSHWNLLMFYIVTEQFEKAETELEAMKNLGWLLTIKDFREIINAYSSVNAYDQMLQVVTPLIELNPTADAYAQLAAIYAALGQNDKAREAANKAVELDPTLKRELETFLDKLEDGSLQDDTLNQ